MNNIFLCRNSLNKILYLVIILLLDDLSFHRSFRTYLIEMKTNAGEPKRFNIYQEMRRV